MQYRQLTTCIFILLNCCIAGVNAQTVNFVEKTGTQNQYEIERIQKITFSPDGITVAKKDGTDESYVISDLRHIGFSGINTSLEPARFNKNPDLKLYPNPAGSYCILKSTNGKTLNGTIQIFTITGSSVRLLNVSGTTEELIDISNLEKGVYLCRYSNFERVQTIQLIKQ